MSNPGSRPSGKEVRGERVLVHPPRATPKTWPVAPDRAGKVGKSARESREVTPAGHRPGGPAVSRETRGGGLAGGLV